jgi:hypothetical protein
VVAINWNDWFLVVGINWNDWLSSIGIGGRHHVVRAHWVNRKDLVSTDEVSTG